MVPNFFIEAKAPRGGADVAKRQACLNGAVGARAMHRLQNFGEDVPVYDGNAHTFSSTYHAGTGTLQLYAHHATGPTAEEEQPEYHMTQINSWGMTDNVDTFRRGATAFRNARDLAQQRRETFIKAANARVAQEATPAEFMEQTCEHTSAYRNASQDEAATWHDSHDELQRYISESFVEDKHAGKPPTTPERQYTSDEEPDRILAASETADPPMSFVSSFTTLSTDTTRPKRAREPFSSPTQGGRMAKSRSRAAVSRRHAVLPADNAVEAQEPCI